MNQLVISCEHARWALPAGHDLGVSEEVLRSQSSWDPGALEIAGLLASRFAAPLITGSYSRMLVDLNRSGDRDDVVPPHSYGSDVPGNVGLSAEQRSRRLALFHTGYWRICREVVSAALASGPCLHLSIHSFCPQLDPVNRQFDVGVLFAPAAKRESEIAHALMAALATSDLKIRSNEPYRGDGPALVTGFRTERSGNYAGIEIEVSHNLVSQAGGCERASAALAAALIEANLVTA